MKFSILGKRIAACVVDALIINSVSAVLYAVTEIWYVSFLSVVVGFAYYTLFEGGEWHATPGKRLFGMQVVNANGFGIDYGTAAVRSLSRFLSGIFLGAGFWMALFSDNRQTLHDKLAGTFVVDCDAAAERGACRDAGHAVVGVTGELAGMRFPVNGNGVMIGRDAISCQIVFKHTKGISRLHCFLSYNPASGMFILSDRNSTYGTFTSRGVRVTPQRSVALKSGERFCLATKDAMFEVV
ncbi:MAG: RDD family protein [Clostridia bacterium]|nr:RDD family protein [Clostridia bacterium]